MRCATNNSKLNEPDELSISNTVTNHINQLDYVSPTSLSDLGQGLSLISVNVRSLLANGDRVQELLDKTKPVIAALQETWQAEKSFEGYQGVYCTRTRKRGGGVGLLIKNGHNYEVTCKGITKNLEYIAIKMESEVIISVYMPPTCSPKHAFEELQSATTIKPKERLTILGDFNINMGLDSFSAPDSSPTERFHDFCRFNSLSPCIWKPTRITKTTATVIDNILTSEQTVTATGIFTAEVADHLVPSVNKGNPESKAAKIHRIQSRRGRKHREPQKIAKISKLDLSTL